MRRSKWSQIACLVLMVVVVLSGSAEALIAPIQPIVAPISSQLKTWLLSHDYYAVPLYRLTLGAFGGPQPRYGSWYSTQYEALAEYGDDKIAIIGYIASHALGDTQPLNRFTTPDTSPSNNDYQRLSLGGPANDLEAAEWDVIGYAWPVDAAPATTVVLHEGRYAHQIDTYKGFLPVIDIDYRYQTSSSFAPTYDHLGPAFAVMAARERLQHVTIGDLPASLTGGGTVDVQWRTTRPGGTVDLQYSVDDGDHWVTVARDLSNPGQRDLGMNKYAWSIPNINTQELRLRIRWRPGPSRESPDPLAWTSTPKLSITQNVRLPVTVIRDAIYALADRPAAPTELTATVVVPEGLAAYVQLYWTDNAYNEETYIVKRWQKSDPVATLKTFSLAADSGAYKDGGIAPAIEYVYQVIARADLDSAPSAQVSATYYPPGDTVPYLQAIRAPLPPTNLQATLVAGGANEVALTWTPTPTALYLQVVQRRLGAGAWSPLVETANTASAYLDTSIPAGTSGQVSYRVLAVDAIKTSEPSNVASVTIGPTPPPGPSVPGEPEPLLPPPTFDGSQSGWAQAEITLAHQLGLTFPGVMTEFQRKITREEFCTIAVRLYEKLSGKAAVAGEDPFADTDNPDILKAFALGIVRGVSATQFAPGNNITRQEMCVMIYRALLAAGENTLLLPGGEFPFGDTGEIATWAMNEVRFCYQKQIMKGTSPTTISPLVNTPREQAIVLIYRTYQAFK